ncbi:MAG: hypothetical protein EOP51_06315 [Sphingobacteriales bacterium]|nr:MAG: hypothetical protein EOP51_06315 [Sphingobacteriales bacterium]
MNRIYTLLLIAAAFTACKKEDKTITPAAPEKTAPYLNKVMRYSSLYLKDIMTDSILLDENGELKFTSHYYTANGNDDYDGYTDTYTRDKIGRITLAKGFFQDYDVFSGTAFNFEYDSRSNISKVTLERIYNTTVVTTYSYDEYDRIVKEQADYTYYPEKNTLREYTYATPGTFNPASMKETIGNDSKNAVTYLYSYDSKSSPFATLPKIVYYMGLGQLGVNNVLSVSVKDENNTTTNIYRYGDNQLPFNKQDNRGSEYKYYYGNR